MINKLLLLLFSGLLLNHAFADSIEVEKGRYSFMAFLFYHDRAITDGNGNRFSRSAVLLRPSWLASAAIDPAPGGEGAGGFPEKTLLARAGAVKIDSQISWNEDENEQDREIIRLVRPKSHNESIFWKTDITLLKTLTPFQVTLEVAPTPSLYLSNDYYGKNCIALMYVKVSPTQSQDKALMQFNVVTLEPKSCGRHFDAANMICANDTDYIKSINYCEGNSGGPLICDEMVAGLQTYVDEDHCKPPHQYQLISKWLSFIECGVEEKCFTDSSCACTVTDKDEQNDVTPKSNIVTSDIAFEIKRRAPETPITGILVSDTPTATKISVQLTGSENNNTKANIEVTKEQIMFKADITKQDTDLKKYKSTTDNIMKKVDRKSWISNYLSRDEPIPRAKTEYYTEMVTKVYSRVKTTERTLSRAKSDVEEAKPRSVEQEAIDKAKKALGGAPTFGIIRELLIFSLILLRVL